MRGVPCLQKIDAAGITIVRPHLPTDENEADWASIPPQLNIRRKRMCDHHARSTLTRLTSLALLLSALLVALPAAAQTPVRVLIAELQQPNLAQLGCPNGVGITNTCRVFKSIHCPINGGGACSENASAPIDDHATTVTKLAVYELDENVEAIVASGSPHHALAWANQHRYQYNIRVVVRTDGGNASDCNRLQLFRNALNRGIAVVHSSGNHGHNGLKEPDKGVIGNSCGTGVIGVGFTGVGQRVFKTRHGQVGCSENPPPDAVEINAIPIDCDSNARPGTHPEDGPYADFFTSGAAVPPSSGSGSSFAAPRIASIFANYFTQFPDHSVEQATQYVDRSTFTSDLRVRSNIVKVDDTYRHVTSTDQVNQALSQLPVSGYYFNPARPGWGLHVSNVRDEEMYLIWYTYDSAGKPIWFTAYAQTGARQRIQPRIREESYDPLSHELFGRLTIDFIDKTSFDFSWDFDGRYQLNTGSERVQLLLGDGSGLGGQWFNPADPGWGFSIEATNGTSGTEYLALYYFDPSGKPVWASGLVNNGGANVSQMSMSSYFGFCQGCPYFDVVPSPVGTLSHQLGGFQSGTVRININGSYPWRPNNGNNVNVINLLPDPN